MVFVKPQKFSAEVVQTKFVTSKTVELILKPFSPKEINFKAGQFVNLKVSPSKYRSYSIASTAKDSSIITLAIEVSHEGLGANYVRSLKVADVVEFVGPSGKFLLREPYEKELVFIATGTGIVPFVSMFYALKDKNIGSKVVLYYGVKTVEEVLFQQELNNFAASLPNFSYKICVSREEPPHSFLHGRVTKHFNITTQDHAQVYLCGNPAMINDMMRLLTAKGIKEANIFKEEFTVSNN